MSKLHNRDAMLTALDTEREQMLALLPQFSDEQWRTSTREDGWTVHDIASHIADTVYGLAMIAQGTAETTAPVDPQTGWFNPHDYNEQRREKNRDLPREKLMIRMGRAFETARAAIATTDDYDTPVPLGPQATKGVVLQRLIDHTAAHRAELELMT